MTNTRNWPLSRKISPIVSSSILSISHTKLVFQLPSGAKWMFPDAYFCTILDIPIKLIVMNVGECPLQKKQTFFKPAKSILLPFIEWLVFKTESDKFTALHDTDKVKCDKTFFCRFHRTKVMFKTKRREQIQLNCADFIWEFSLQFFPTFLLKL